MKMIHILLVYLLALSASVGAEARVPTPEDHLGHRVGADYKLASWTQIVDYFEKLAAASDRVALRRLGVASPTRGVSAPRKRAKSHGTARRSS